MTDQDAFAQRLSAVLSRIAPGTIRSMQRLSGGANMESWSIDWASGDADQSRAARNAFAIHPGWGGDCTLFASIVLTTDVSVWYGIGKAVTAAELVTDQLSVYFPSEDILQIYIPGLKHNAKAWTTQRSVYNVGGTFSNGRGFQGHLPHSVSTGSSNPGVQMTLF